MKLIKLFITYFKRHHESGNIYAGRASGKYTGNDEKDAFRILRKRDGSHHKNKEGYGTAELDQFSLNNDAIRGREQILIDKLKEKEICGNDRNGISKRNKKRNKYLKAATKLFGKS